MLLSPFTERATEAQEHQPTPPRLPRGQALSWDQDTWFQVFVASPVTFPHHDTCKCLSSSLTSAMSLGVPRPLREGGLPGSGFPWAGPQWHSSFQRLFLFTFIRIPLSKSARGAEGGVGARDLHRKVAWPSQQPPSSCPQVPALEVRGQGLPAANAPGGQQSQGRPLSAPSLVTISVDRGRELAQSHTGQAWTELLTPG